MKQRFRQFRFTADKREVNPRTDPGVIISAISTTSLLSPSLLFHHNDPVSRLLGRNELST